MALDPAKPVMIFFSLSNYMRIKPTFQYKTANLTAGFAKSSKSLSIKLQFGYMGLKKTLDYEAAYK